MPEKIKNNNNRPGNTAIRLKASLTLFDATGVGVGAIIGAGIFVVTGIVAGLAGSALIISVLIAGAVSLLTALSTAELARRFPEEGGVYEYAHRTLSPFAGFITGWMWTVSNIFVGAAVSLGFAYYLSAAVPSLPVKPVAVLLCLLMCGLNTTGARHSSAINNVLVIIKVAVLFFFIAVGAVHINPANLSPFSPLNLNVIHGAYYIFFAFSGFARITVIAGEVIDAEKNVPKAVLFSLAISAVVYILVGFVAVGTAGAAALGASKSPLADAIRLTGETFAARIVSLGALFATASVLLTSVMGVSRMVYAMTGNGELPRVLGTLHPRFDTPYYAIWLAGGFMAGLAYFADLTQAVAISTFASLFYYAITNISALRLPAEVRQYPRIISWIGVVSCLGLLVMSVFETTLTIVVGIAILITGAVYYNFRPGRGQRSHTPDNS